MKCSDADGHVHDLLCDDFAALTLATKPSEGHILGIFFPADEVYPELVWIACRWKTVSHSEGDFQEVQVPDIEPWVKEGGLEKRVGFSYILNRRLPGMLAVAYNSKEHAESQPSKCINMASVSDLSRQDKWRGNFLAHGLKVIGRNEATCCRDLDMNDFRHIVNWFLTSEPQEE